MTGYSPSPGYAPGFIEGTATTHRPSYPPPASQGWRQGFPPPLRPTALRILFVVMPVACCSSARCIAPPVDHDSAEEGKIRFRTNSTVTLWDSLPKVSCGRMPRAHPAGSILIPGPWVGGWVGVHPTSPWEGLKKMAPRHPVLPPLSPPFPGWPAGACRVTLAKCPWIRFSSAPPQRLCPHSWRFFLRRRPFPPESLEVMIGYILVGTMGWGNLPAKRLPPNPLATPLGARPYSQGKGAYGKGAYGKGTHSGTTGYPEHPGTQEVPFKLSVRLPWPGNGYISAVW